MRKLFGLGGRTLSEYLELVVDNDWKDEDKAVVEREQENEETKENAADLPPERRWQYKKGEMAFWAGDPLRNCGVDVTFAESRQLWRMGWVKAMQEYIAEKRGPI